MSQTRNKHDDHKIIPTGWEVWLRLSVRKLKYWNTSKEWWKCFKLNHSQLNMNSLLPEMVEIFPANSGRILLLSCGVIPHLVALMWSIVSSVVGEVTCQARWYCHRDVLSSRNECWAGATRFDSAAESQSRWAPPSVVFRPALPEQLSPHTHTVQLSEEHSQRSDAV